MIGLLFTIVFFPLVGRVVRGGNAFLAGAGVTGLALFVTMVWHVPMSVTLIALSVCGVLALRGGLAVEKWEKSDIPLVVVSLFLLIATAVLPLADYDGRAFWVLKAKAIAHEGTIDGPFFHGLTAGNPRNEYPLLVPLDAAAILTVAGDLDDRHTRWLFALFAIAFALEIRRRCGPLLSAAFLLLPQILLRTTNGGALTAYSDIALGAFVACAFFELVDEGEPWRFGFWVACVALTKNEGLPLALLLLAAGAWVFRKRIATASIVPAIAIAHLLIWRARIERSDEENFARTLFNVPAHLDRFGQAFTRLLANVGNVHDWGLVMVMIAIAFFFARRGRGLAAMIVVPMLFLYASAVAVTNWAEVETMNALAPRVLTHLLGPLFFILRDAVQRDTAAAPRPA
ncbi:MAG: hypothetical protein ACJ74H_05165 [Thermoanaerobaculia bacterium]